MEKDIEYVDAPVIGEDKASADISEALIENLKHDVVAYKKALEAALKDKENYIEQFEIDKAIWEILQKEGALKKISPTFVFEQDEKYVSLQEKKQYYKIRMDKQIGEARISQYDLQINDITEALARAEEKLSKFGGSEVTEEVTKND